MIEDVWHSTISCDVLMIEDVWQSTISCDVLMIEDGEAKTAEGEGSEGGAGDGSEPPGTQTDESG